MLDIKVNGKGCKIGVSGSITDIIRDMIITVDKLSDCIGEHTEDGAKFFNETLSLFMVAKAAGFSTEEILNKINKINSDDEEGEEDEKKGVDIEDLLKDIKEHMK